MEEEAVGRLNVYPELSQISFNTCGDVLPCEPPLFCGTTGHQV